ncbi:MAG: hypothetical protein J6N47_04355 [Lachnospiraceae bacterium]|nr:hypothetical protein [Lachnospiraceae bacterium]
MKKKLVMTMLAGVMSLALCTACTSGAEAPAEEAATEETVEATEEVAEEPTEETAEEPTEEAAEGEDEIDIDAEVETIQASLTYMGGLYVNGNPDCDMELALFKNEEGELLGLVYDQGSIEYGYYETEDGTLEDGTEYTIIKLGDKTFGYYFDESLETGILIDQDGNVNEALALDESVARDLVTTTIVGEAVDDVVLEEDAEVEENAEVEEDAK